MKSKLLDSLKENEVWEDGYGRKYMCWMVRHNYHGFLYLTRDLSFYPGEIKYFDQDGYDIKFTYPSISNDIKEKTRLVKKVGTVKFIGND